MPGSEPVTSSARAVSPPSMAISWRSPVPYRAVGRPGSGRVDWLRGTVPDAYHVVFVVDHPEGALGTEHDAADALGQDADGAGGHIEGLQAPAGVHRVGQRLVLVESDHHLEGRDRARPRQPRSPRLAPP